MGARLGRWSCICVWRMLKSAKSENLSQNNRGQKSLGHLCNLTNCLCFQATYLEWSGSGITWIMKHQRDPWICDQSGFIGSFEGSWSEWSTIMDKSLGTNLHFWCFYTHTRCEYNFTCLTSPPTTIQCWKLLPAISSGFQHCIWWGRGIVMRF